MYTTDMRHSRNSYFGEQYGLRPASMLHFVFRSRLRRGISRLVRQLLFLPLIAWYTCFRPEADPSRRWRFFVLSVGRFATGVGSNVSLRRVHYVSQLCQPDTKIRTFNLRVRIHLYLGDVLKTQGFFADAERLYRRIIAQCDSLVLLALGDLVLLQAVWADEFSEYAKDGIAIRVGLDGWHQRTFSEAIGLLEKAAERDPTNPNAWWLLADACLRSQDWQKAASALKMCHRPDLQHKIAEIRALYGLDRMAGTRLCREHARNTSNQLLVNDVMIEDGRQFAASWSDVGAPTCLCISSNVVKGGEIRTFRNRLHFEQPYVGQFLEATVLPPYGVVVAGDRLIRNSSHLRSYNLMAFHPYIRQRVDERVLIYSPSPDTSSSESCIFFGANENFYHWLVEDLPRLQLIDPLSKAPLLLRRPVQPWQKELLNLLNIDLSRVREIDFAHPQFFRNLTVPSRLSRDLVAHPASVRFLREALAPKADDAVPRRGKRIFLMRRRGSGRALLNESAILPFFKKAGFNFVDAGALTISQQIELFSDVEIVAGPGGASFANMIFAPQGAKLLMLASADVLCETFTSMAASLKQPSWWCAGHSYPRPHVEWLRTNFDFAISPRDIEVCFESLL